MFGQINHQGVSGQRENVSAAVSLGQRRVCLRGSDSLAVSHERDQTKGSAASMWWGSVCVCVWKKERDEIIKIKKLITIVNGQCVSFCDPACKASSSPAPYSPSLVHFCDSHFLHPL